MAEAARRIVDQLEAAFNAHDVDAFVALFAEDYTSEQPAHPERAFSGRDQLHANWSNVFTTVPDVRAERKRLAVDEGAAWLEWRWRGTSRDGVAIDICGVTILGIEDGLIRWGRLYMEDVPTPGGA